MNRMKKLWDFKTIRIICNWIAEKNWKWFFIKLSIIAAGIFLVDEFLVSMRWVGNVSHYDEEFQRTVFSMAIGFQWTTLIGMLGCIMIVLGIFSLFQIKQYKISAISLVTFLINFRAWYFLWYMSERYYYFELENPLPLTKLHYMMQYSSYALALMLVIFLFKQKKGKLMNCVQVSLAVLLIIVTLIDVFLKTATNRWFLYQVLGVVLLMAVLCSKIRILEKCSERDAEEVMRKPSLAVTGDIHEGAM